LYTRGLIVYIQVEEEVTWIPPEVPPLVPLDEMRKWRTVGTLEEKVAYSRRIRGIFVNNDIVEELNRSKVSCLLNTNGVSLNLN